MEDFITNINLKKNLLTKNELKACMAILDNLTDVQIFSFTDLSNKIGITKASILRFCQKIGYSGYNEFKYECIKYVNSLDNVNDTSVSHNSKIEKVASVYSEIIPLISKTTSDDKLNELSRLIRNSRKIYAVGAINSAIPCMQMHYAFLMFGYEIIVINSVEELRTIDLIVNEDDLLIVFSVSATTDIVKSSIKLKENQNIKVAIITMNNMLQNTNDLDLLINLPSVSNLKNQSLLDSVPIFTVFVEILIYYFNNK